MMYWHCSEKIHFQELLNLWPSICSQPTKDTWGPDVEIMTLDPFVLFFKLCLPWQTTPCIRHIWNRKKRIHTETFIFNTLTFTVKLTKPWTPEIFMECYCVARNKPIRREITKPQTATVISLWFWGLLAYPELYCDWPVHNQHSWNFSGVHSFLSLTVNVKKK